jgi:DNA-binding transcriptional regulator YiaG
MTHGNRIPSAPMTPGEFRAALARLQLTQTALAKRWGINLRTIQSWATGERPIPATVTMLLRLETMETPPRASEIEAA